MRLKNEGMDEGEGAETGDDHALIRASASATAENRGCRRLHGSGPVRPPGSLSSLVTKDRLNTEGPSADTNRPCDPTW